MRTTQIIIFIILLILIFAVDSPLSAQKNTYFQNNKLHDIISRAIDKYRAQKNLKPFTQDKRLQIVANKLANRLYDHVVFKKPYPYEKLRQQFINESNIDLAQISAFSLNIAGGPKGLLKYLFEHHRADLDSDNPNTLFASHFIPVNNDTINNNGFGAWVVVFAIPDKAAMGDVIEETLFYVNQFRAEHNLDPYRLDPALSFLADLRAKEMADQEWYGHFHPETGKGADRVLEKYRYGSPRVLENLAFGQETPEGAVISWKNSKEGHREAMIDKSSILAGIGYRYNADHDTHANPEKKIITYPHIWVLLMSVIPDNNIYTYLVR